MGRKIADQVNVPSDPIDLDQLLSIDRTIVSKKRRNKSQIETDEHREREREGIAEQVSFQFRRDIDQERTVVVHLFLRSTIHKTTLKIQRIYPITIASRLQYLMSV